MLWRGKKMVISIWDSIVEIFDKVEKFMIKNYDEPFLWVTLFVVLMTIAYVTISSLANK